MSAKTKESGLGMSITSENRAGSRAFCSEEANEQTPGCSSVRGKLPAIAVYNERLE